MSVKWLVSLACALSWAPIVLAQAPGAQIGVFENHSDVGRVLHPGSAGYDESKQSYTLTGSGENIWSTSDAFQFVWKKVSGDVALAADISFPEAGRNPHRKAVLMVRETLDPDSAYADIALHGNGLTSLQYRDQKGALTREVQANVSAPKRVRIVKRGESVYMFIARDNGLPVFSGGSTPVSLRGAFYVGIGVCSHESDVNEKAVFSNVDLTAPSAGEPALYSTLETVQIDSTNRHVVYSSAGRFEAPNWTRDGFFLFNQNGHIERMPVAGGTPAVIDTGFANRCNNDHGAAPDGSQLAISDQSQGDKQSRVYIVPMTGGTPRLITANSPSYWHGWSPDGKTLAFVGERNGDFDIYTIPSAGGGETRLTTAPGLDDGPEYSPDGKYIYFNSVRTGLMQIWRMRPDGGEQERVTFDDFNNWFPHISPDGKWMVFLTYEKDVTGHPEDKNVMLRLMSLTDHKIAVLAKLFGGQGTINVPSWSLDSAQLAFVSYHYVPESQHNSASDR